METINPGDFNPRAPDFYRALVSYSLGQAMRELRFDVSLGKSDIRTDEVFSRMQEGLHDNNSLVLIEDGTNQLLYAQFHGDNKITYLAAVSRIFDQRAKWAGITMLFTMKNASVSLSSAGEGSPAAITLSGNSLSRRGEKVKVTISPDGIFLPATFGAMRATFPPQRPFAY
ncbi:MAG: hypothetical protein KGJ07_08465 [Patescibacteria group bacterium]|nr:hypothetical protein [Patescibacteria group bacterium]